MINYCHWRWRSMFKGGLSGFSWELVNDDIDSDANVLEAFLLNAGAKRLVAFTGGSPYYSEEDDGINWVKGTRLCCTCWWLPYSFKCAIDRCYFCFESRKGWYNNYVLNKTVETAKKYSIVKTFTTSDGRNWPCVLPTIGPLYTLLSRSMLRKVKIHTPIDFHYNIADKNTSSFPLDLAVKEVPIYNVRLFIRLVCIQITSPTYLQ